MYKLLPAIILSILLPSNFANASSNWTNVVKPIVNGCTDVFQLENLTKAQKDSIKSKTVKKLSMDEGEKITYILKNATAYGYPINKIQITRGYEAIQSLYFSNEKFMAQKNTVKTTAESGTLTFNRKEKSITCGWMEGGE